MPVRPCFLSIPTIAAILVLAAPCPAGTAPAFLPSDLSGADLASNILFETAFPINELLPDVWTREQQQEILSFRERMKKDDRIFLIVQATVDPIGSGPENAKWGKEISLAVGDRLRESGIRADRIQISGRGEGWTDAGLSDVDERVRFLAFRSWLLRTFPPAKPGEKPSYVPASLASLERFLQDPVRGIRELAREEMERLGFRVHPSGFGYAIDR